MLLGVGDSVLDQLRSSPYFALRDIHCEYREGVLTLQGHLPTHYLRQVALNVVSEVAGVTEIVDRIEVKVPGGFEHASQPRRWG